MFTGLIEEVGILTQLNPIGNNQAEIHIGCGKIQDDIKLGDSVAVDGVCLTVVSFSSSKVVMEISTETMKKTLFSKKSNGDKLNLERALRLGDRLGGHLVQGHVDSMSRLLDIKRDGNFYEIFFTVPKENRRYFVDKGSVTINGISLTLASLTDEKFSIAVIPHTFENTTLSSLNRGDSVHIETDIMARYVENLLKFPVGSRNSAPAKSKLSAGFLAENGFF